MATTADVNGVQAEAEAPVGAQLDEMHVGDIRGALGTIRRGDVAHRSGLWPKLRTFLAILGPGLIVMVGDNDAGAFGTYTQSGQNYGTTLLWTLLLLVPVLYVNQEMVLRLGVVSGVGHARLILERFGKFWGAFSVIDLFILNGLTIVTEFIGISLAMGFLGLPKLAGVAVSAILVMIAASTGNFRRFERFAIALCFGSLLLLPVLLAVHAPVDRSIHDFFVPGLPKGADLSTVMLPAFYAVYLGLIAIAAVLVVVPGTPLGLLTNAVQTLAGVLLPSATVFLLLLSNDKAVLGPWANTHRVNIFTAVVIAILVMLSVILTASVLFPSMGTREILGILIGGSVLAVGVGVWMALGHPEHQGAAQRARELRATWRMPPLSELPKATLTPLNRFWLVVLRGYLILAVILVIVRVTQIALHQG